ncbi:hypothetical protein PT2222_500002 [Paraburkholderia tropica]
MVSLDGTTDVIGAQWFVVDNGAATWTSGLERYPTTEDGRLLTDTFRMSHELIGAGRPAECGRARTYAVCIWASAYDRGRPSRGDPIHLRPS